jgi:hypothetical protein
LVERVLANVSSFKFTLWPVATARGCDIATLD